MHFRRALFKGEKVMFLGFATIIFVVLWGMASEGAWAKIPKSTRKPKFWNPFGF